MKKITCLSLLLVFWRVTLLDATCTGSCAPCEEGSGTCTEAVRLTLAGNSAGALNSFKYGKYCGAKNKCQKVGKDVEKVDRNTCKRSRENRPCPAIPCDDIDSACKVHDSCLDSLAESVSPGSNGFLPTPERCNCDVNFVAQLAIEATTSSSTSLCDEDFYSAPISGSLPVTAISLLKHEATLLAAPFCCVVTSDDCVSDANPGGGTNTLRFGAAFAFCSLLLETLKSQGISNLCPTQSN